MTNSTKTYGLNKLAIFLSAFLLILGTTNVVNAGPKKKPVIPPVRIGQEGKLVYSTDSLGNQIPDFSYCGYHVSEQQIPFVKTLVVLPLTSEDITADLQKAIDYVASLPLGKDGFRGAIQFEAGTYHLEGRFRIETSGIVFRGTGFGTEGTVLEIGGTDRETLFRVKGGESSEINSEIKITDTYVPVNAMSFKVEDVSNLNIGDQIFVNRPATDEWIHLLGMNYFGGENRLVSLANS